MANQRYREPSFYNGVLPGIWMGAAAPNGDAAEFLQAPVGSIYFNNANPLEPVAYIKTGVSGADSDWANFDNSSAIPSALYGTEPGLWYGTAAINGATGSWLEAQLGSIYVQVDAAGSATSTWQKIANNGATADWKKLAQDNGAALIASIIRPASDSATAVRVQNAAGTVSPLTVDTSTTKVSTTTLVVTGTSGQNIAEFRDSTGALDALISPDGTLVTAGLAWTARTSAADNDWRSVCYGNGLFVAVANSGTGNRVMTSPDGVTWTARTSAADNNWLGVCYGNGLFVAVAYSGTGNRVMTSPDGVTWTARTSAADNDWYSVCYGNGLFVAVANSGAGNRVMTSPDGVTWTVRTSAADNNWRSVCYGNGLFVAVAYSGTGNRVMTSGKAINRDPLAVRFVSIDQNSSTNATPVLTLRQADVSEDFIHFTGTSAADNSQSLVDAADLTTPGAVVGWIKIYVQDDASSGAITDGFYWMPFYATPTA